MRHYVAEKTEPGVQAAVDVLMRLHNLLKYIHVLHVNTANYIKVCCYNNGVEQKKVQGQ